MKLRSAFVGLLLLAVLVMLVACDTNQAATPEATSISVSNPTSPADTQPTTAPSAADTPGANPATSKSTSTGGGKPTFIFMPRRGGPGSTLNLAGANFTPGQMIVIRIGVPQPIGEPLASVKVDDNGKWNASIKVPATDPSGQPITATDMQVVAMDENNQIISSEPFIFIPKK